MSERTVYMGAMLGIAILLTGLIVITSQSKALPTEEQACRKRVFFFQAAINLDSPETNDGYPTVVPYGGKVAVTNGGRTAQNEAEQRSIVDDVLRSITPYERKIASDVTDHYLYKVRSFDPDYVWAKGHLPGPSGRVDEGTLTNLVGKYCAGIAFWQQYSSSEPR